MPIFQIIRQIVRTGIKTEAPPLPDEALRAGPQRLQEEILRAFGGALSIRQVDPVRAMARTGNQGAQQRLLQHRGLRSRRQPAPCGLLLVTGPVSRHMAIALRRAYDAMPESKPVVAVGDCGCDGGILCSGMGTTPPAAGCERHPGGRGGERLPAHAHGDPARHPHRDR